MTLKDCISITSGVNAKRNPQGKVYYLGVSDFVSESTLHPDLVPSVLEEGKFDRHYLNKGDVLVLSRGNNGFPAFVFNDEHKRAIASAAFLVLRNPVPGIMPSYLSWYLNLNRTQEFIIGMSRGSSLQAINKSLLEELEIPSLPIEMQEKLVALHQLKERESRLVQAIDALKTNILEIKLRNILTKYE